MRLAVLGHVEWLTFLRLPRHPEPGAILHADAVWEEPAGGGSAAAADLARLAQGCTLFTALGDDEPGRRAPVLLREHGVSVRAAVRRGPQRRATTLLGPCGERTIIVHGPAVAPRGDDPLGFEDFASVDGVYVCKGDAAAVRLARRARVLVATARMLPVLQEADVAVDALVRSASDEGECYAPGDLPRVPGLVASTEGAAGGSFCTASGQAGRWAAAPLPGARCDTYGAGDCFAAGLTFALASGLGVQEALALAASRGALALCRPGALGRGPVGS